MNCKETKQRSGALHLTQKVDYGMILLSHLGNTEDHCSIKTIAEENNLSFAFMQKIAGSLQKATIIKAERGKYGGYILVKPLTELTILEVVEALEGKVALVPCLRDESKQSCVRQCNCKSRAGFEKLNKEIQDHVLSKPLTDFIL